MISQEDIAEGKKMLAATTNDDLKAFIAYMHWIKTTGQGKEIFGSDYSDELLNKTIELAWQESNKRGIQVKDVQDIIHKIAQASFNENMSEIRNNAELNRVLSQKKQKKDMENLLKGLVILAFIVLIIYLIYKATR